MELKFKKLRPEAVMPSYAKPGDAGMDLTAIGRHWSDKYVEYHTGLAVEIPEGHVGLIFPRSSISNMTLSLSNSVGVIDSQYRGEIKARFRVTSDDPLAVYKPGERIAQLLIMPVAHCTPLEVEELSETERGTGGFGHTGLN